MSNAGTPVDAEWPPERVYNIIVQLVLEPMFIDHATAPLAREIGNRFPFSGDYAADVATCRALKQTLTAPGASPVMRRLWAVIDESLYPEGWQPEDDDEWLLR